MKTCKMVSVIITCYLIQSMNNIKNMAIKESVFLKFLKFPCPQMNRLSMMTLLKVRSM